MMVHAYSIKPIVAAFVLAVGFSLPAVADTARLDRLYSELLTAPVEEALRIEGQIAEEWSKSGSPAIDLLLKRGQDAMEAGDYARALEHFSAAVDHAPDFAEAYSGRAQAFYFLDMIGPALDDLRQVLVLNPRHFHAMAGFAVMLEELGRDEDALEVYRQVQAIHPNAADIAPAIDRLELKLEGQTL